MFRHESDLNIRSCLLVRAGQKNSHQLVAVKYLRVAGTKLVRYYGVHAKYLSAGRHERTYRECMYIHAVLYGAQLCDAPTDRDITTIMIFTARCECLFCCTIYFAHHILQVRQRGVVRKPAHVHNYVHNAQMVVDALAGPILNMDLSHITGEAIVRGDTVAIRYGAGDTETIFSDRENKFRQCLRALTRLWWYTPCTCGLLFLLQRSTLVIPKRLKCKR